MSTKSLANSSVTIKYSASTSEDDSSCKPYEVTTSVSDGGNIQVYLCSRKLLPRVTMTHNGRSKGGGYTGWGIHPTKDVDIWLWEEVVFDKSDTAEASNIIYDLPKMGKIEGHYCAFDADGNFTGFAGKASQYDYELGEGKCIKISSGKKVFGALNVYYSTPVSYRFWIISNPAKNNMCMIMQDEVVLEAFNVQYDKDEEATNRPVRFKVVDISSGVPLSNATVTIDSGISGQIVTTNSDGITPPVTLRRGQTYPLKVSRMDYLPTNLDEIQNDEFTVP